MHGVQAYPRGGGGRALPPEEQLVELGVQRGERHEPAESRARLPSNDRERRDDGGGRAHAMPPAEVER